jgi:hypothetical protein
METTKAALNDTGYQNTWEEGKKMNLVQALEYARQVVSEIQTAQGVQL